MKKIAQVVEVEGEGLESLLGQRVTLMCANYFYTGVLEGVNDMCVKLVDAAVVFETGPYKDAKWSTKEDLPGPWYVQMAAIESFGLLK